MTLSPGLVLVFLQPVYQVHRGKADVGYYNNCNKSSCHGGHNVKLLLKLSYGGHPWSFWRTVVVLNSAVLDWEVNLMMIWPHEHQLSEREAPAVWTERCVFVGETLLGLLSFFLPGMTACVVSVWTLLYRATGSNTRHTRHTGCLQTSWLEANSHFLLKIKSRHVSAILVFYYIYCQCVFSRPGAETLTLSLRPDRQTDSVGGEWREQGMWALGLLVWGSHLQGDKLLAIYPSEPLACSIYGNTTDTPEIQADPLSSPQKAPGIGGGGGGGGLCPLQSSINIKYVGSSEGIIQPVNRKIITVSLAASLYYSYFSMSKLVSHFSLF